MRVAILSGILFLSGVSALIFETLWLRLSGFELWKFGVSRCIDSFQLYGGSGVGQCHRSTVEILAVGGRYGYMRSA